MKKNKFTTWVKEHKTELLIVSVTIVGTVLVVKKWDAIKGVFKTVEPLILDEAKEELVISKVPEMVIPDEILDNLTGKMLTARALGEQVGCSAQAINKKIVAAGLAKKLPCGEYILTDAGDLVGQSTWKTTAAGHSFSNLEWDEKILELIFNLEGVLEVTEPKERVKQVLVA